MHTACIIVFSSLLKVLSIENVTKIMLFLEDFGVF